MAVAVQDARCAATPTWGWLPALVNEMPHTLPALAAGALVGGVSGIGTQTITLLGRMSWLGGRGSPSGRMGDNGRGWFEESPDFTEQGDC